MPPPTKHLRYLKLWYRQSVTLEGPGQPRRLNFRLHLTTMRACSLTLLLHLHSYRILKHFPIFMFWMFSRNPI